MYTDKTSMARDTFCFGEYSLRYRTLFARVKTTCVPTRCYVAGISTCLWCLLKRAVQRIAGLLKALIGLSPVSFVEMIPVAEVVPALRLS